MITEFLTKKIPAFVNKVRPSFASERPESTSEEFLKEYDLPRVVQGLVEDSRENEELRRRMFFLAGLPENSQQEFSVEEIEDGVAVTLKEDHLRRVFTARIRVEGGLSLQADLPEKKRVWRLFSHNEINGNLREILMDFVNRVPDERDSVVDISEEALKVIMEAHKSSDVDS